MNVWKCKLIFPTDTLQQKIEKTDLKPGAQEGVLCRGCCGGGGGGSQFLHINVMPNRNRKSCYSLRTFMRSC